MAKISIWILLLASYALKLAFGYTCTIWCNSFSFLFWKWNVISVKNLFLLMKLLHC